MTTTETSISDLTASEAMAAVAGGSLTPTDLVEAAISRIELLEDGVKAWSYLDLEGARKQAAQLTEEAKAGKLRGPLHGLPVGLKDVFHVAGMPTKADSKAGDDFLREEESTIAARFRAAGAIILGKLHTAEFASTLYQPITRNAWNLEHNPGGSSSGSGAAVGARMITASIGTQTGGSNLRPAAYNGVFGFMGTYGRISRRYLYAVSYSLDHPGVIARSPDDLALIFSVVGGYDPDEPTTLDAPLPPPSLDISSFAPPRFGLLRDYYTEFSDPEVAASVDAAAATMATAGASVKEISLPPEFPLIQAAAPLISGPEQTTAHARRHATRAADFHPSLRDRIEIGALVPANYYLQAQRIRRWLRTKFLELFEDVDYLILPTSPIPPPKGDSTGDASFLSPWTFLGYPAGSVPSGLTGSRLPIGMQLVGRPMEDHNVLLAMKWAAGVIEPLPAPPVPATTS